MPEQAQLDQIKADILQQNICPDLAKTANQLVFGSGNIDTKVVFIGEAPGKKEDETGLPFVGAAGKFLDQMLESIHLQRSDIYITNIVKYRPPENRDPSVAEKEAFLPFLYAQLAVIKPKLVVTLGRHSTNCFLPGLQIGDIHGQPHRIKIIVDDKAKMSLDPSGGLRMDGVQGLGEKRTDLYKNTVDIRSHYRLGTDTAQSDDEDRSEVYEQYSERELESATKSSAVKFGKSKSFAHMNSELVLTILPLYHPAAALYNGKLRQTLLDDFAMIPQLIYEQ